MTSDVPPRFAVFSDIHANLPALRRFLESVDAQACEGLYCLGDIVGYGAHPNECCEIVRERGIPAVMGNHDLVALTLEGADSFNEIARQAVRWTHDRLTPQNRAFLENLPYTMAFGDATFVHASPIEPRNWHYVLNQSAALANFEAFDTWLCFIGHSHQPLVVELEGDRIHCPEGREVALRRDRRYLINVGSIGQPRDRDPDSCYVTIDMESGILKFHRLTYPVEEAGRAIEDAGLPPELAYRLTVGL